MGGSSVVEFMTIEPTDRDYLRGIVLFGQNVASYKFALAKSIVELATQGREAVPLTDLAEPFSRHVCEHLQQAPRQSTSRSSKYLDACRAFNEGRIPKEELLGATARLGFVNVIDAFHVVGSDEVPVRFFEDRRRDALRGIVLTPALHGLAEVTADNALAEVEARWRLVETAWELGVSSTLVAYDGGSGQIVAGERRRAVTTARDALNGYQKGKCFYCYRPVEIVPGSSDLADVDHLFPHVLQRLGILTNLDGIWNLVLACVDCNRGPEGKWDQVPDIAYVARLGKRNDYLISSHHPLRDVLMTQTGTTAGERRQFLQAMHDEAYRHRLVVWATPPVGDPTF